MPLVEQFQRKLISLWKAFFGKVVMALSPEIWMSCIEIETLSHFSAISVHFCK